MILSHLHIFLITSASFFSFVPFTLSWGIDWYELCCEPVDWKKTALLIILLAINMALSSRVSLDFMSLFQIFSLIPQHIQARRCGIYHTAGRG